MLCKPKKLHLNIIGYPDKNVNIAKSDAFLVEQLNKDGKNVGEILVTPNDTVQTLEQRIALHPNIRGLKCYHVYAKKDVTFQCDIGEYLPECAWEVANRHKMAITLHMVKDASLADEGNQKYIIDMAKKYPDATLILAHAARAFAAWTAVEHVDKVANLANVWFDFSVVCGEVIIPFVVPREKQFQLPTVFIGYIRRTLIILPQKQLLKVGTLQPKILWQRVRRVFLPTLVQRI